MPITKRTVKVPLGMRRSYFFPISTEPAAAHPTYGNPLDMGEAVKGYLTVQSMAGDIYGDDVSLLHDTAFVSAQAEVETTCSDLELNSTLFGHTYADGLETSGKDDRSPYGAYAFIEPILKADKALSYRATFLYKCSANQDSEKTEADTRKNDFNPKYNAVTFAVVADNLGSWRARKDFDSLSAADAWIMTQGGYSGT